MSGELIIGLMSGTSVDGIDAALVGFQSQHRLQVVATLFIPYSADLKQRINRLAQTKSGLDMSEVDSVDTELAELYADTCISLIQQTQEKFPGINHASISAISNHGQTVRHEPNADPPYSVQLGNTQTIANLTRIKTIGQFRQGDLAAGGQGAPLMPAFHNAILGQEDPKALILNIGGIANITQLNVHPAAATGPIGFDTGPGNTLLDQWINLHKGKSFDRDGNWAVGGEVIDKVLKKLLSDPYFVAPYPKSTGPDYFNLNWLNKTVRKLSQYRPRDIQATLLQFTVESVKLSVAQLNAEHNATSGNIYICGGGAQNGSLMASLVEALPEFTIQPTDVLGIPADWVESAGFAWLGYCHLHDIPNNLPSVTGARHEVVMGEACLPEH